MRHRLAWILFSLTGSLAEREKMERYWSGSLSDINPLWSFVMNRVRTSFEGSFINSATTWNFSTGSYTLMGGKSLDAIFESEKFVKSLIDKFKKTV